MSATEETFKGDSYEIVAWAHGQTPLIFRRFGSYQGEWLMLAKDAEQYFLYKDYYGSCSCCDSFEGTFGYSKDGIAKSAAVEFAKAYPSFIEVPLETMRNLAINGAEAMQRIFPGNINDAYSEIDLPTFVADCVLVTKLEEGIDITVDNILAAPNAELKQRSLKTFGYERFVKEAAMEVIDKDGEDSLLARGDVVFAYIKDSSTPRRYLLRVPPNMRKVKEAIAWTFNLTPAQYQPLIET